MDRLFLPAKYSLVGQNLRSKSNKWTLFSSYVISEVALLPFLIVYNVVMCVLCCIFAGYLLFKDYCETMCEEPVPQLKFLEEVGG